MKPIMYNMLCVMQLKEHTFYFAKDDTKVNDRGTTGAVWTMRPQTRTSRERWTNVSLAKVALSDG